MMTYRIIKETPPVRNSGIFAVYRDDLCYERFPTKKKAAEAIRLWAHQDAIRDELHELLDEFAGSHNLSRHEIRDLIRDFD